MVTLPLTSETRNLIGKTELMLLPSGAIVVNVARGLIIEEQALYQALSTGRLWGAGLDVWYNYPSGESDRTCTPPSAYPFHKFDNVVMSPHRGGIIIESIRQGANELAMMLNMAVRGETLPNKVNASIGY